MHRHEFFNLYLHDDRELEALLQNDIIERATLHEWPLSCVQRITLSSGRRLIYKVQSGPFVEAEFYDNARSDLLVSAETIFRHDDHVAMLIEHIDTPPLKDVNLGESEIVNVGRTVLAKVTEIAGDLPVFVDVSTEEKWKAQIHTTLKNLSELVASGQFSIVDSSVTRNVERWSLSRTVLSALNRRPGYVHGDLAGDNLFALSQGYRVIDWQKTKLGPTDLDLVTLLESMRIDPLRYVSAGTVWASLLLQIRWLTNCAVRWFPEGRNTYDAAIARLAARLGKPGSRQP